MAIPDFTKEMTPDIDQGDDKNLAIEELMNLMNQPGWQRIVKILKIKINKYDDAILNSEIDGQELARERDRRHLCMWFEQLPDILLTELVKPEPTNQIESLDPYSTVDNPDAVG